MSFYRNRQSLSRRFQLVLFSTLQASGLPFADILSEREIEETFREEGSCFARDGDAIFTPALTLWAFLSQVLHQGEQRSCLAAVSRVIVLLVALGREPCCKNSGSYCKARVKLPEIVFERLATRVAEGCEKAIPCEWLWKGRHVKMADGSTVSMPDTAQNQNEYPQQASQKPGLGFPIARLVMLFSLSTAMTCGMAIGPYKGKGTGELALMRQLLDQLESGDILLTDRFYCSYFMIALLAERKVDFIARLHHLRKENAIRIRRLGKNDHSICWPRPSRPRWMDEETYHQMPESLTLRQVDTKVEEPGFRVRALTIVTTLVNKKSYSQSEISELYRRRWMVELDIRSIKCSMGMDILRSKSPEMVRKEIWACLLAYNLLRKTLLQAARKAGLSPRQLSFTNALQTLAASWTTILSLTSAAREKMLEVQMVGLANQIVGKRPGRYEPRAIKRRPSPIRLLTVPREEARTLLRQGNNPFRRIK